MAKAKNKRNSGLSDKVNNKRNTGGVKKKLNPFEVHINKEKLKVLGKKSKHDRGLPGVSRAKAIQKRKETLGTEMKLMNKTNAFIDKRIGEKNNQLSSEDRMIARFAAERARQHTKKDIYNLADDEILTHRGQTLEQIEKFDDPRSSDEEDEEGKKFGGLGDDFVSEGHFGGGILSKTESRDGAKSHKDLIEQLIAKSKKRKAEKQKEKEQTLDLTEKLDSEWKDLQPVVFKKARVEEKQSAIEKLLSQAEKKGEDYDKMMRELKFEKRGTPSDCLKNEEKQAKEEKERLEKLEREREQRMFGDDEITLPRVQKTTATKHRSADDLDDNFELEDEQQFMLAYDKDGKPLVPENVLKDYSVPNAKPKFEDGISDTSSEDDDESEEEDEDELDGDDGSKKVVNGDKSDTSSEDDDESEEEDEDELDGDDGSKKVVNGDKSVNNKASSDEETSDNDMKQTVKPNKELHKTDKIATKSSITDEDSSDEETSDNDMKQTVKPNKELHKTDKIATKSSITDEDSSDEETSDNDMKQTVKPNKELHKTDKIATKSSITDEDSSDSDDGVPENHLKVNNSFFNLKLKEGDNLKELLTGKTPSQQSQALQKLIKSYDPGLAENNKELLSRLFAHMLQYVNDLFTNLHEHNVTQAFMTFDRLAPYFYDLAQTNKVSTKKFIVELIKEKHENFMKKPKKVPDLDTLIFFKLVSLLYPTSDFRHPVTTPSLIFMSEILALSRFDDAYSISRGLFITSLILEYTVLSKRFVPSAINFLRGILYLCANASVLVPIQVVPPFKLHRDVKILNLEDDCRKMADYHKMAAKDLVREDIDNGFKMRCFYATIRMLKELFDHYSDLEVQVCLFEPHISLLGRIELDYYPKKVASEVGEIVKYMKESLEVKTFTPMCKEKPRPKALRMYEPDVQEVFTGSKSSKLPREQAERARLQTKYKKEMKGALREIRRDKAYIASVKMKQRLQSDNVRKEKVKQIYKEASIQQGELNKLKRMK